MLFQVPIPSFIYLKSLKSHQRTIMDLLVDIYLAICLPMSKEKEYLWRKGTYKNNPKTVI